jgi:hypothetical protein
MGSRFRKFDADHAQQVSQTPSFESGVQQGAPVPNPVLPPIENRGGAPLGPSPILM